MADYIGVTYIPPEGMEDKYYTVKKGDTLYGIARQFGISVDELEVANNLTTNPLRVGQTLVIPEIEEPDVPNENIYIVKKGDTLYSIANQYGMTVNELKSLNNLTNDTLSIGQELVVSEGNAGTLDTYTVKAGDSLYSIARKYGITVDALKSANGKSSNLLSIGEVLVIPTSSSSGSKTYVVKSGDSLWKIATSYGTSVNAIKQANGLSNDVLSIGQVLIIP